MFDASSSRQSTESSFMLKTGVDALQSQASYRTTVITLLTPFRLVGKQEFGNSLVWTR
jgi:hypothetical protein